MLVQGGHVIGHVTGHVIGHVTGHVIGHVQHNDVFHRTIIVNLATNKNKLGYKSFYNELFI